MPAGKIRRMRTVPDKRLIVLFGVLLGLRFLGVEVGGGYGVGVVGVECGGVGGGAACIFLQCFVSTRCKRLFFGKHIHMLTQCRLHSPNNAVVNYKGFTSLISVNFVRPGALPASLLSSCLPVCLFVCLSGCLSVCLLCLSSLSVCLSVCLVCDSVCLSVCWVCVSICCVCLSVCLSALLVTLSACTGLSRCLPVQQCVCVRACVRACVCVCVCV